MRVRRPGSTALAALFGVALGWGTAGAATTQDPLTPREAARFLSQATLGASWEEIERTSGIGLDAWLDEQMAQPIGLHQPFLDERASLGLEIETSTRRWAWWQQVMESPDALRQRIALGLSEVFVVSDAVRRGRRGGLPRWSRHPSLALRLHHHLRRDRVR